jgi:hypothetical protein
MKAIVVVVVAAAAVLLVLTCVHYELLCMWIHRVITISKRNTLLLRGVSFLRDGGAAAEISRCPLPALHVRVASLFFWAVVEHRS